MSETIPTAQRPKERNRYIVAWGLIIVAILSVVAAILYNFSAFMMLFNKGEITLHSYTKVAETVMEMDNSFTNVKMSNLNDGDEQLYYETQDGVGRFWIGGYNNSISYIHGTLNNFSFSELGILQKYESIDTMLRPICQKSDILTAEIALIKISSRYALTGPIDKQWTQTTDHEKISIQYHPQNEEFEFSIVLSPDANSQE